MSRLAGPSRAGPGEGLVACPLCGHRFEAEEKVCASCALTARCSVRCCPQCGFSLAPRSAVVDAVRRWFSMATSVLAGRRRLGGRRA